MAEGSARPDPASTAVPLPSTSPTPSEAARNPPYTLTVGLGCWLGTKVVAVALYLAGQVHAALWAYFFLDPWFLWQIIIPSAGGFGPITTRFKTTRREVWLTIDDGPDPITTPQVLALLDRYQARATFFVIGENIERHPQLANEMVRRGHTLANHTHTHPAASFWIAAPSRIRREIDRCNAALEAAGLPQARYFRAPVGIKTVFLHPVLAQRAMHLVAWSARGYDSVVEEATATQRILKELKPGAIVLLHEGRSDLSRVTVIERVLEGMTKAGFTAIIPDPTDLTR